MNRTLLMLAGVLPLAILAQGSAIEPSSSVVKKNKECGCSLNSQPAKPLGGPVAKRRCIAKADVE